MRTKTWGLVVLLALIATSASAGGFKKYKGKIVVASSEFPVDLDEGELAAKLKEMSITSVPGADGAWSFYIMGFLSKKPGSGSVNLVIYPTKGTREPLYVSEIAIDPKATIMTASAQVSTDDGIKAGEKYEVVIGRMVGRKETVYARVKITFK